MIIIRCANGIALFKITRLPKTDSLQWQSLADGAVHSSPRTPTGWQDFLSTMAQKAITLNGAITHIVDLPEME